MLEARDGSARYRLVALAGDLSAPVTGRFRVLTLGATDRHARVPALAFDDQGSLDERLIRTGSAMLASGANLPADCRRLLERAETAAIAARRGLWAAPGALIEATDREALARIDGAFAVVQGRVVSVRTVGPVTYVNFGGRGSGALTLTLRDRALASFRAVGLEPAAFQGQILRVRGIVTIRRGPEIAATVPEAITIATAP